MADKNFFTMSFDDGLEQDKKLVELFNSQVVIDCLLKRGMRYARTVKSTHAFNFPANRFQFHPTCWIIEKNVFL